MPNHSKEEKLKAFERLLDVMDTLREKCPWDREQTNESLRENTIEETMELSEAILNDVPAEIRKELGDVLLHIVFYAKIGDEKGQFDIADVCNSLCDKLIFRHPHVYGEKVAKDAAEVLQNWEIIKTKEKDGNKTVLSGVPRTLPSLIKAERIQEKAANVGFDWEQREDVWDKVVEEMGEVREACSEGSPEHMQEEFGDLLFAVLNASRLYGVDPEAALNGTCTKFRRRFTYLEEQTLKKGRKFSDMTLSEMDAIWDEAKAKGL